LAQPVDEAHACRLLPADAATGKDHVDGLALADEAGQADGAAVAERDAPAATKDAEDGITGGHAQVTPKCQFQAACDRVALDSGDHRLRQPTARRAARPRPARAGGADRG